MCVHHCHRVGVCACACVWQRKWRAVHSWLADASSQSQLLGKSGLAEGICSVCFHGAPTTSKNAALLETKAKASLLTPVIWIINVCKGHPDWVCVHGWKIFVRNSTEIETIKNPTIQPFSVPIFLHGVEGEPGAYPRALGAWCGGDQDCF